MNEANPAWILRCRGPHSSLEVLHGKRSEGCPLRWPRGHTLGAVLSGHTELRIALFSGLDAERLTPL
jgi:hypothetical protein